MNYTQALYDFVAEKHKGQVRQYNEEPYVKHLERVAQMVPPDPLDGSIALCHDIFEDTDCTPDELFRELYEEVGFTYENALYAVVTVQELTNDYESSQSGLNRATRKDLEAERLSRCSTKAKVIKCADIIDNLSDIAEQDPKFAVVYAKEKKDVLDRMSYHGESAIFQHSLKRKAYNLVEKVMGEVKESEK